MRYQFIEENRKCGFRLRNMLRVLNISSSGYYEWRRRTVSNRNKANNTLLEEIRIIHKKSRYTYGSPRITAMLKAQGLICGKNRVANIMRKNNIQAKMRRRFKIVTTRRQNSDPVAQNLIQQRFSAERPNQLWSSDITYLWTRQGWLYLSIILDVYSRQVVGYSIKDRLTTELVTEAFTRAIHWRKIEPGLIFHSDRGSQYTSDEFQRMLKTHGIRSSMSSSGNCYDNAIAESFFHSLKTEHVYFEKFNTKEEAERSIFDYIEIFYNRQRLHSALGYKSPFAFEKQLIMS